MRIKQLIVLMGLCLAAAVHVHAQVPGQTCQTAIPMTEDFSVQIAQPQTVWYSAWTFDLPLTVTFAPQNNNSNPAYAPVVEMDFTCTPGVYTDSILCSLFCKTSGQSGIDFDLPHVPNLKTKRLDDGTFVYYLSLGKSYRDLLLQVGIDYNVQVFVKVTFKCPGELSLAPDNLFANCVDKAKFMHFGDTMRVAANDINRHVIVPYVQWQEDTIYYKWSGTTPCTIGVTNTCDFNPTNTLDGNIIQMIVDLQPGDSVKVKATDIYKWVHNPQYPNEAGMYFAKVYSAAPGVMQITKAPQSPPRRNATLLKYDKTYMLNAHDTALFAIPNSWNDANLNTLFTTPTEHVFRMEIASDPDFSPAHLIKAYQFDQAVAGRRLGILGADMKSFWSQATEQYLYVRFDCSEATSVTPTEWAVSACAKKTSNYITSLDTTFIVKRASTGGYYKLNYAQWVGGDLAIAFNPAKTCKVILATDCDITLSPTASNVLYFKQFTNTVNKDTIPADTIAAWASRVDDEGYIYLRCEHTQSIGTYRLTLSSTAPADSDPVYPCATIFVSCTADGLAMVSVSQAQHIEVQNIFGRKVDEWNAAVDEPHVLTLPAGQYVVNGAKERITINL